MSSLKEKLEHNPVVPTNIDLESKEAIFKNIAYYVNSDQEDSVLIAIGPQVNDRFIFWFDGNRQRMFPVTSAYQVDDILIISSGETQFFFQPMTFSIYQSLVKPRLIAPPDINSQEELDAYIIEHYS